MELVLSDLSLYYSMRGMSCDITPLSRWPCLPHPYTSVGRGRKRTNDIVRKRVGEVNPGVMVYLTCAVICLGRRGEIIHGLKRQPAAPSHADVRFHLPGFSVIQPLAAREEIGTASFFSLAYQL